MKGLGTIVNVLAIIAGSGIGILFRGKLNERFQQIMMQGCGLATLFIGMAGALEMIFTVEGVRLSAGSTMLIVVSLVLGGLMGELVNIEKRLDFVGEKLKGLVKKKGDKRFVEGFVIASLVVCVGAMAICGPLEEGLTGNSRTLFIKAVLDLVIVAVFASVYGLGAAFSALSVGVFQGSVTLLAGLISPFMSERLITNLSGVGSVLIFAVGINLLFPKKIRVGNLLPALLVPAIYEAIMLLPIFK